MSRKDAVWLSLGDERMDRLVDWEQFYCYKKEVGPRYTIWHLENDLSAKFWCQTSNGGMIE